MNTKTLGQIQFEAVRLAGLLNTLHMALPHDASGCEVEANLMVGWAAALASQIADDVDAFDLRLSMTKAQAAGGTHE